MLEKVRGVPSLQVKLRALFAEVTDERGAYLTNREVASRALSSGCRVSEGYISHMRSGRASNPSFQVVVAVAAAFGVPVDYFLDSSMTVEQARTILAEREDASRLGSSHDPVVTHSAGRHVAGDITDDNERAFVEAAVQLMRSIARDTPDQEQPRDTGDQDQSG